MITQALVVLGVFTAKLILIFLFIILVLIALFVFFAVLAKSKQKGKGKLHIKSLNEKYEENAEIILAETLSHKEFKHLLKEKKTVAKAQQKTTKKIKNIFVINFHGDMRATEVDVLREEVTAIINVADSRDEVVVRLESPGGVVHGYGLGAAQLGRLREHKIPLIVTIDKVAASGGYLMASMADKIIAAPFAIIGSIGVIVQLPNFHRLLQDKHIDFEQFTAGSFKRTITVFGKNTEEGRKKLREEIEEIHQLFKNLVLKNRPQVNIDKVATGEHWLGLQALDLKLVDEIKTSDDYLLERSKDAHLYEICFEMKKSFLSKLNLSKGSSNSSVWY